MRSLDEAAAGWQEVKIVLHKHRSIAAVRAAVRAGHELGSIAHPGARSAWWKTFLLFDTIDSREWQRTLRASRSAYNAVREHYFREADSSGDPSTSSSSAEETALRDEIVQDVERCMPDNIYFRQPATQMMLVDILYIFCRLNPDLSYRQGMHELLAPILWVVERDAIDLGQASKAMGEDAIIRAMFDADFVEHDAFALFCQVMQTAKAFYEQTTHSATDNPIVTRSQHIFNDILPQIDQELAKHLHSIDVVPQVFLIRWIRLLFGRELSFDQLLSLWDVIFAVDPSFESVDYICLLMLLRMRWQLLEADYSEALTILLQRCQPPRSLNAASFALDALYLRDHPNFEGSSYLVLKYTDRAMQPIDRPNTPPALQRNITAFSGNLQAARSTFSPSRRPRQSRQFENMLQSTAKNIYARGERLGIGKAVRSAVDEVHRKALEIREAQGASSQSTSNTGPQVKVMELEQRQSHLAKLLDEAVVELWNYQKFVAEKTSESTTDQQATQQVESLSLAIARVQFVQVYLQDSSLPLSDPEAITKEKAQLASQPSYDVTKDRPSAMADSPTGLILGGETPATSTLSKGPKSGSEESVLWTPRKDASSHEQIQHDLRSNEEESVDADRSSKEDYVGDEKRRRQRPALADSSFSWMLGQEADSVRRDTNTTAIAEAGYDTAPVLHEDQNNPTPTLAQASSTPQRASAAFKSDTQLFPDTTTEDADADNAQSKTTSTATVPDTASPGNRTPRQRPRRQNAVRSSATTADDPFSLTVPETAEA